MTRRKSPRATNAGLVWRNSTISVRATFTRRISSRNTGTESDSASPVSRALLSRGKAGEPMSSYRMDRTSEDIKRELTAILRTVKDPRVTGLVSIVRVEVSRQNGGERPDIGRRLCPPRARPGPALAPCARTPVRRRRFHCVQRAYRADPSGSGKKEPELRRDLKPAGRLRRA